MAIVMGKMMIDHDEYAWCLGVPNFRNQGKIGWNTHYPDIFFRERARETGFSEASVRLGFCTSSKIVVILAECRQKGSFKVRNIKTSQAVGFYDCNMVHYGPAQGA